MFRPVWRFADDLSCRFVSVKYSEIWISKSELISRVLLSGKAPAFQAGDTGSIPVTRSTISDCSAYNNTDKGFVIGNNSTISGCSASYNTDDGIWANSDSTITGNTCESNGYNAGDGAGIYVSGADNRIDSNNVTDNDRGIDVDNSGNLIIRNSASGNTTNYVIAADNRYGPIIDITASGTPPVSGSSASSTTATTHPWANFSF